MAADETYRGLRAQKTVRAGGSRLGVLKWREPQGAVQRCFVVRSWETTWGCSEERPSSSMPVMSSCLSSLLPELGSALRPGRASGSLCPAPRGAPRLATLRGGDSHVRGLVLSSSSHSVPPAGGSFAVEDDMEEEDESEEEEEEVLHSQHSKLDTFRGGEWVAGGLGTAWLLVSLDLGVAHFKHQELIRHLLHGSLL